jgi:hypothetical protein
MTADIERMKVVGRRRGGREERRERRHRNRGRRETSTDKERQRQTETATQTPTAQEMNRRDMTQPN